MIDLIFGVCYAVTDIKRKEVFIMNNKTKFTWIAVIVVVIALISYFVLTEQMNKGTDPAQPSAPVEDLADKTPLKEQSDQVLERLTYCQRAILKKQGNTSKEEGFDELWQGVNEVHGMAYAARMTQEDMAAATQRLNGYSQQVDALYAKYTKVIEKLQKKDAKQEKQEQKKEAESKKKGKKK